MPVVLAALPPYPALQIQELTDVAPVDDVVALATQLFGHASVEPVPLV